MKTFALALITASLLSRTAYAETSTAGTPIPSTTTLVNSSTITDLYRVAVVPSAKPSHLNVYIEWSSGQTMSVVSKATDGSLLAKRFVNKKEGNLQLQFDLLELADGAYTVEVLSGSNATTYPVTISTKPAQEAARTITLK